ncbi:uncharacterized protein [Musca autumnalis]|uniref:uncharacterized protein n=1 Tax=Musca autumnalis TaxID=221902 RepID=UPI003CF357CB
MEHVIKNQMLQICESRINDCQFAFRKGHNTTHLLLQLTESVREAINDDMYTLSDTRETETESTETMTTFSKRNRIRVGQWNVHTLREPSRLAQLEAQTKKYNIAVLGISEIRWPGNGEMISANENLVLFSGNETRSEYGVGFIISKELRKTLYSWSPISERIIMARFCSDVKKYVTIVQCYAPTEDAEEEIKDQFYNQLTATIHKVAERAILLLTGDFNAKIVSNNDGTSEIMGKHGLGDVRTNRGADIDSDHELVVATIKIKLRRIYKKNQNKIPKRFNVTTLKNSQRRDEVSNALRDCVPSTNTTWEDTYKAIINIAKDKIGYNEKRERKVWMSENTWNLINERNNMKIQKNTNPTFQSSYSSLAKRVKRAARNDKRKYLELMASDAEAAAGANNMKELHQIINHISNKTGSRSHAIKDKNGNLLTDTAEQTRKWRQHFMEISNCGNANNAEAPMSPIEDAIVDNRISTEHPSVEEIASVIQS